MPLTILFSFQMDTDGCTTYKEGDFVAVISDKYNDRPLIGHITKIGQTDIQIDWYIGTYTGIWRPWKGRDGRNTVTFTETIPKQDILRTVTFTKGMRLPGSLVSDLRSLYV